jgi:hypothetical protein
MIPHPEEMTPEQRELYFEFVWDTITNMFPNLHVTEFVMFLVRKVLRRNWIAMHEMGLKE